MSWFSQNKFIGGLLVVFVVGLAGTGYYLSGRYSAYKTAMEQFDQQRTRITLLKSKPLFPSAENVELIKASVLEYESKVTELQKSLLHFQKPLNSSMKDTEFQQLIKERVAVVQTLAESGQLELPGEFYMGLLKYRQDVPEPGAVGLLEYQLRAIERLMEAMVRSSVEQLVVLERDPLGVESNEYEAPVPAPVLESYPLALTMVGTHESVRGFFNDISNDTEYFYRVRYCRIENSAQSGPQRSDDSDDGGDGNEDLFIDDGDLDDEVDGLETDAKIVMGNETIQVYMVVDLVRFVEVESEGEATN